MMMRTTTPLWKSDCNNWVLIEPYEGGKVFLKSQIVGWDEVQVLRDFAAACLDSIAYLEEQHEQRKAVKL